MDENTFECPNCGATIYPEMTRCTLCGQNMYPEDLEQPTAEVVSTTAVWGTILGSLLIGWMVAAGIAIILHFIVASFVSPSTLGGWGKAVLFLAGPLGVLAGGFVGSGLARQHSKFLGGMVGVLTLPVLVLFGTHWVKVTFSLLTSPWGLLTGFLTIFAGVIGGWLSETFTQESDWKEKWRVHGWEDLLYQDLLRKVRFNGSAADRLIEFERKQDPQASRLKLIQSAIERWERDNR